MLKKPILIMSLIIFTLLIFSCSTENSESTDAMEIKTALMVTNENSGYQDLTSSTILNVEWSANELAKAYQLFIKDINTNIESVVELDSSKTKYQLTNLKAATEYKIELIICFDDQCIEGEEIGPIIKSTEAEYWQLQGTGNSISTADLAVNESSTLAYIIDLEESWADKSESSLFYFNPSMSEDLIGGMQIATVESSKLKALNQFTALPGYGLGHACNQAGVECKGTELVSHILAFQLLPMQGSSETFIRAAFESKGSDGHTRIMYLDSQDGPTGLDFNSGSDTICSGLKNYQAGGPCEPQLWVDTNDETGFINARQFKIGYHKQNSSIWDQSPSSFMIITGEDTCGLTTNGLFMSIYNGVNWNTVKDDNNCAKPIARFAHGPVIVDLSKSTYKLYYEDETTFRYGGDKEKPMKMIYANAKISGSESTIDSDDFEVEGFARDVNFLWPNGELISAAQESGFGDHYIYMPNNSLDFQVMYLNLNGFDNYDNPSPSPGIGMAVLVNP
jgi:hypothetical protein